MCIRDRCIDGFRPSLHSLGSLCSNCSGTWYGVPLYLFLEFVPITVFYVVILVFRISMTSSPMIAFVFFSQIVVNTFVVYGNKFLYESSFAYRFLDVLTSFYGFWNLDFFRYILPPFCISPNLKLIHITFLYYISAFYPICLICITWICIELHFRHFKPIVWLWSKVTRCLSKHIKVKPDYSNSLINVFATFFLLSYAKIVFISSKILSPTNAVIMKNYSSHTNQLAADPSIGYFSKDHLPFVIVSIFILLCAVLPPTLLLTLYPVKLLRSLLFKSHLSTRTIAALNMLLRNTIVVTGMVLMEGRT